MLNIPTVSLFDQTEFTIRKRWKVLISKGRRTIAVEWVEYLTRSNFRYGILFQNAAYLNIRNKIPS
jgi:hypothetical protein